MQQYNELNEAKGLVVLKCCSLANVPIIDFELMYYKTKYLILDNNFCKTSEFHII